ncbi:uncharacterized protein C16orf78 homolog [Callospermophilus lateralis]|uniref:uncharacterized protein C16orf78 homolog n=1 Tax=Callospermophilus lateralis TaxID=76772 RepID=UPI0040389E30
MSQDQEDPKRAMPTERKSVWRTPEERRMSDLTRVLEWLERRRGKKKLGLQVGKEETQSSETAGRSQQVTPQAVKKNSVKNEEALYRRSEQMGARLSIASTGYNKESSRKSELDIKDAIALESTQRPSMFRRQSSIGDPLLQEAIFSSRRGTLIRDWGSKAQDASFERKLKTLMDKSTEPKMESLKMLKPEEVLSCRYLRLSKNNIRTLLKLCKDAGLNMDIHPHMTESEIDSKKVFGRSSSSGP